MSVKDVREYYDSVVADYSEMLETLKEMEELAAQDVVNPDKVEDLRKTVEPLKLNYQTLSWVIFLLDKPVKKSKQQKYTNSMKKKMNKIDPNKERSPEAIFNQNKEVIESLNTTWLGAKNDSEKTKEI